MKNTYVSILLHVARSVWRRRIFWVIQAVLAGLPILFSILIFLVESGPVLIGGASLPGMSFLALYLLLLPLLVGRVIIEDFGPSGEIVWSTPVDYLVHFAGVFSGLWLALLSGTLIQLAGWFLADLLWVNLLPEWAWGFSLAVHMLATTVSLCLIFLLAVLIRRSLPVLLAWTALWVWVYFSSIFIEAIQESYFPVHTTAFTNLIFHNLTLSPSLGLGLQQDQALGMATWFIGLGLAAVSLALLLAPRLDPRRASRREGLPVLFTAAALAAAVLGFILNSRAIAKHAIPPSPQTVQIDTWEVLSQNTQVEVDASRGSIAGTARLELALIGAIEQPELILRLNPGLTLTDAKDESGQTLPFQRVGDSVILSLGAVPQAPVKLDLAWQGRLQIPFSVYDQQWQYPDAPYPHGFDNMPKALQAFIHPAGGFLLRDGDWIPWPWTTTPHQAASNRLTILAQGGEAAAATPLQNGQAVWEGPLPSALLAFVPAKQEQLGDMRIAASRPSGQQQIQWAYLFARAVSQAADLFQVPAPRLVVVASYLSELVWSGDLLLVPDGSGYYLARPWQGLYGANSAGDQQARSRAALAAVVRSYLLELAPPAPREFKPMIIDGRGPRRVVEISAISEQDWQAGSGHWLQEVETFDVLTNWNPRRVISLSPQGKWSVVAFWLAMELADVTTRQGDLELLAYFAGEGKSERGYNSAQYQLAAARAWPNALETEQGREIVWELHQWTETLGVDQALPLFAAVIQENRPETVEELFAELERQSEQPIGKEQP